MVLLKKLNFLDLFFSSLFIMQYNKHVAELCITQHILEDEVDIIVVSIYSCLFSIYLYNYLYEHFI